MRKEREREKDAVDHSIQLRVIFRIIFFYYWNILAY